jgi:serine phosphatase RsbU (regulator of sigma subunit)
VREPGDAGPPPTAPEGAGERRWRTVVPVAVGCVGVVLVGVLATLCWLAARHGEERLLQQQTDQAGAVLAVAVAQIEAPLTTTARAMQASDGDAGLLATMAAPLLAPPTPYRSVELFELGSTTPVAAVGPPSTLASSAERDIAAVLDRASRADPMAIVDLLDRQRTLGFAVVDDPSAPRYVLYAERRLSSDPNVRRRSDAPFSQLRYAIYLETEADSTLLGSSERELPLRDARATTTIPYGDHSLLLVATANGRLGDALTANLWWIVAVAGALVTAAGVVALQRLNRRRADAERLAAAIAVKHEEQRSIAETLQLGLLPRLLDVPPHTDVASRYWPAGDAQLIGGDFWDVFRIDDRRWGLLIGDVCGKGMEAAALTGLVRYTARTAAQLGATPAGVLRAVHAAMAQHRPPTFCTVCFATYEPAGPGSADGHLVVSLGGHPRPLLVRDRRTEEIGRFGTVLGMVEPSIHEDVIDVHGGDTLVMFTDGLTDAPGDQAVPYAELEQLLGRADDGVEALADAIRALKRRRRPSGSADDTAVLVVRFNATSAASVAVDDDTEPSSADVPGGRSPATMSRR